MTMLPDNFAFLTQDQKNAYYASLDTATPTTTSTTTATTSPTPTTTNTYTAPTYSPVTSLSSQSGANIVDQNVSTLQKIEQPYTIQSGDTLSALAAKNNTTVEELMKANPQITNPDLIYSGAKLNLPVSSPAGTAMLSEINKIISGGNLTAEQQAGLTALQASGDSVAEATAKARAALDAKNYQDMDYWTAKAEEARKKLENDTAQYYKDLAPLRAELVKNMTPTQREQQLGQQLSSMRNQIEQFKLQTEEDKFNEYQGQTAGFAGGRASEIDIRANFKLSRMALEEKNLLGALGLEQELRKMNGLSIEQQIKFLQEDHDMQMKVDEKLNQIEDDLYNKASQLQDTAKSALTSVLTMLKGVNPADLTADMKVQLEQMAARSGLPYDLVLQSLDTQYKRQVFEDAMDVSKENRLSGEASGGSSTLFSSTSGGTSTTTTAPTEPKPNYDPASKSGTSPEGQWTYNADKLDWEPTQQMATRETEIMSKLGGISLSGDAGKIPQLFVDNPEINTREEASAFLNALRTSKQLKIDATTINSILDLLYPKEDTGTNFDNIDWENISL